MIVIIDHYDSFTYNLYQMVGKEDPNITVVQKDASLSDIQALHPTRILLSPGSGRPQDTGVTKEVIAYFYDKIPILGVCLGHQTICEVFGGTIIHARQLMHGKQTPIHIANGNDLFKNLPPLIQGARYNSLSADRDTLPDELLVIAEDDNGEIMGVKHNAYPLYGLQFHPESFMTPKGDIILHNFVKVVHV